jgi:signal transduction histidine kinase
LVREPGKDLRPLVELAAQVCQVPTAAINLITGTHQHQVAAVGFEESVCARDDSMCAAVIDEAMPVVVEDAREDARVRANPFVTGEIAAVRFYASAPLRSTRGVTFGRLCVFDDQPRRLDEHQTRTLQLLADRVVDVLELGLRTRELEASIAEVNRARDELDRSNRRLSHFAAQVSHDLRTPLTAMLLNTEIVAQDPAVEADDLLAKHLAATLDAGRRMTLLIEEILESAQVGAAIRMGPVDLYAVADAVTHDVGSLLAAGELTVEPLPTVVGDEQQLYSVLLNLVTNALKFTRPEAPARVRISAERLDGRWRVEVTDNGVGIPLGMVSDMFRPFVRGSTETPGSGLGLASAKRIVEAHEGRIGLEPALGGVGTTAWFDLPD